MTNRPVVFLFIATLSLSVLFDCSLSYAIDPRFELDPGMLQQKLPPKTPPVSQTKAPASLKGYTGGTSDNAKQNVSHPMKRRNGPIITKRPEAEKHIVSQSSANKTRRGPRLARSVKGGAPKLSENRAVGHRFALFKGSAETVDEGMENARLVWDTLMPVQNRSDKSFSIKEKNYTLDLSPDRFPLFPAADGGKILVEAWGNLSPSSSLLYNNMIRACVSSHMIHRTANASLPICSPLQGFIQWKKISTSLSATIRS